MSLEGRRNQPVDTSETCGTPTSARRNAVVTLACCSDTHGSLPPLLAASNIVAWLHAGDVYEGSAPTRGVADIRGWLSRQKSTILAVRGNHDHNDPAEFFANARDITGSVQLVAKQLWVAGIGWCCESYDELPTESHMDAMCIELHQKILRHVPESDRLILVTHYPADVPDAPNWPGGGGGYAAVGDLITQVHPAVVIQGHVHDWFGVAREALIEGHRCLAIHPGPKGMLLHVEPATGRVWVESGDDP